MSNLVLVEHENGNIVQATLNTITAAQKIGGETDILLVGSNLSEASDKAKNIAGINKVLVAENASLENNLAESITPIIVDLASNYTHILANSTTQGKNIMPRVAALLDVMQLSDISDVIDADTFERPIYAGNAIATVKSSDTKKVITVRATSFELTPDNGGNATVETISSSVNNELSSFVSAELSSNEGPELATAKIVVSGGRGMGDGENFFAKLNPLSSKLNAAIGASRAAVDSGFCPNDHQVGQTGKVVAPDLYIAIGISGAIQHQAGMKDSKVIVAINNDPDAPIFQIADYGLVADLNEAIPNLTENL